MMLPSFDKHEFSQISLTICLISCTSMHLSCFLGKRYIAVTESMWAPEMAKILQEEFKPLGKIILVGVKK